MTAPSGAIFSRILVGTDFSRCSEDAVRMAGELARAGGAALTVLHVQEPGAIAVLDGALLPSAEELAAVTLARQDELDRVVAGLRARGVQVDGALALGAAAGRLVEHAREHGCDLLVVGSHGRGGLAHALLGSVAEQVMRRAPCPVLTVRPHAA